MGAPTSSVKAVVAALCANGFVTLIKFGAFMISGSGAMLSEAIHSAADTGNQGLLFLGIKRASRERDVEFPYGYEAERFVFGLLSAAGIFFVGAGVTIYHGIAGLIRPHMPHLTLTTFLVLGLSLAFEGSVLLYAIQLVNRQRGATPFMAYLKHRAEPATMAVLFEDSVAVLGLCLAGAGILASYVTHSPVWDSLGSIVVGVLLGAVAVYLMQQNRELLLSKAVPVEIERQFIEILRSRETVLGVHDVKTRQLAPEVFHFKAEVLMDEAFVARELDRLLPPDSLPASPAERNKLLSQLAQCAVNVIAREIDSIEEAVRQAIPQARHIDLEVHHD